MQEEFRSWINRIVSTFSARLEKNIAANKSLKCKVVFGPVVSRRLGRIIGINNIKPGVCSYDCVYCPSGKTNFCSVCTNYCLSPYQLHLSVKTKLEELESDNQKIDFIVFAGSGEPTLDSGLSKEISLLREFGFEIAVFTNSSLLWNTNVRESLLFADLVSLKIDTVKEETWLKMNRPHRRLDYNIILDGIKQFSKKFKGRLVTETMLIKNINDNADEIEHLSKYLNVLNHSASYFLVPMYPPAVNYAVSPEPETLSMLSPVIKEKIPNSVLLCCPEKEEFYATDDFEGELLGLLSIHPVNVDAVKHFIKGNGEEKILNDLIEKQMIKVIEYRGKKYFTIDSAANINTV